MGRFFTSTQIYNPKQLGRDEFKAYFFEKMKKEGYEVCEADCAELSYVLVFADNRKWVTLSSEAYEQGNRTSQADTARIAKMLGTYCVNTIVIDSDCAMLDLYDNKGKKADTAVIGRADDYIGDDIPEPVKAVWEQFLSTDSTWGQFMSVVQGDYAFVEDGLSELAPVIGMDSGNILFEYEDADENNENICYLSFRKADSKKEKKLTLNAAFKQVFGETLEPLGFQIVKGKYPYFVRVVNDELLHVITMTVENCGDYANIKMLSGIATVYRKELSFDKDPKHEAGHWLMDIGGFYRRHYLSSYERSREIKLNKFSILRASDTSQLLRFFENIFIEIKKWVLPNLDNATDIDSVINFMYSFFPMLMKIYPSDHRLFGKMYDNEAFLFFKSGDVDNILKNYKEIMVLKHKFEKKDVNHEFEMKVQEHIQSCKVDIEHMINDDILRSIANLNKTNNEKALANWLMHK